MEVVAELRAAGLSEAADILERGVCYVATTGSEWLGELGLAVREVRRRFKLDARSDEALATIQSTTSSRKPYGVRS